MARAVFPESKRDEVSQKMKELGVKGAFERFQFGDQWYIALQTTSASLYYYCKSLMTKEDRDFFY